MFYEAFFGAGRGFSNSILMQLLHKKKKKKKKKITRFRGTNQNSVHQQMVSAVRAKSNEI